MTPTTRSTITSAAYATATLAALALLAGCGAGSGGDSVNAGGPAAKSVALQPFSGPGACADLEAWLEDTAVLEMRAQLQAARDGAPGWGGWAGPWRRILEDGAAVVTAQAASTASAAPAEYTTTNVQVAGVDEADFVKNDGTRIFVLSGSRLHAVRSWPPEQTQLLGSLPIDGHPRELFLDGANRAVVFSTIYEPYPLADAGRVACLGLQCGFGSANTVKVTEVDVSDPANLRVLREVYLPGGYVSARKVASAVRIVLSDPFRFPPELRWHPDYDAALWSDAARLRAAWDALIVENERRIRERTLEDWLPPGRLVSGGATTSLPHACSAFSRVGAPVRLGVLTVATLDLASGSVDRTSILAQAGEIYASQRSLYVATRHWWSWPEIGQEDITYLHKFDIGQPERAVYLASGTVGGHIVDQFSLDEAASGHLRVVTTVQTRIADQTNPQNVWGTIDTVNRLSVLEQQGDALVVVGRSPDLARGERVQSSRIVGDRGFVVTFRQVDPLFTFDLSDPRAPRVVAELKIPGFSTYLHPIGPNHLLGIGTYLPEPVDGQPPDWRARALQLAIYDVGDLASPRQTHVQLVGTAYGWSDAQSEHRAFNWFAARGLLAIPFADWDSSASGAAFWGSFTSDLRLYSVDPVAGFTPRGALPMRDLYHSGDVGDWTFWWQPSVRRSVMADDFVYAISDAGIRVAHVADLSTPLASVVFPGP